MSGTSTKPEANSMSVCSGNAETSSAVLSASAAGTRDTVESAEPRDPRLSKRAFHERTIQTLLDVAKEHKALRETDCETVRQHMATVRNILSSTAENKFHSTGDIAEAFRLANRDHAVVHGSFALSHMILNRELFEWRNTWREDLAFTDESVQEAVAMTMRAIDNCTQALRGALDGPEGARSAGSLFKGEDWNSAIKTSCTDLVRLFGPVSTKMNASADNVHPGRGMNRNLCYFSSAGPVHEVVPTVHRSGEAEPNEGLINPIAAGKLKL